MSEIQTESQRLLSGDLAKHRVCLQRGPLAQPLDFQSILISLGPSGLHVSKSFYFERTESPHSFQLIHHRHSLTQRVPLLSRGAYHWAEFDGLRLILGCLPWGTWPDEEWVAESETLSCYVPFVSWDQQGVFDGPLLFARQQKILGAALPGAPARLLLGSHRSESYDYEIFRETRLVQSWRKSLAFAFRRRFSLSGERIPCLRLMQGDARAALIMLGMRCAFPRQVLALEGEFFHAVPQWKRLSQNLNYTLRLSRSQREHCFPVDAEALKVFFAEPLALQFLQQLQKFIPFMPETMLNTQFQF